MSRKESRKEKLDKLREQTQHQMENYEKGFQSKTFPLDLSKLDKEMNFYHVKEGLNRIHIIAYVAATDNDPITVKGSLSHCLAVYTHKGVGVNKQHNVICPKRTPKVNKPCPVCEARDQEWQEHQDSNALTVPKSVCRPFYVIIDEDDPNKELMLFNAPYEHFEKRIFSKMKSFERRGKGVLIPWDDNIGNLIVFDGEKDPHFDNYIEPNNFDFEDRKPLSEDLLDDVPSLDELMMIHSYEKLMEMMCNDDEEHPAESDTETTTTSTIERKPPTAKEETPQKEEEDKKQESKTITRRSTRRETTSECPGDGTFGESFNQINACNDEAVCDENTFNKCQAENKRLEDEKKKDNNTGGRGSRRG